MEYIIDTKFLICTTMYYIYIYMFDNILSQIIIIIKKYNIT